MLKLLIRIDSELLRSEFEEDLFSEILKLMNEEEYYGEIIIKGEEGQRLYSIGENKRNYSLSQFPIIYKDIDFGVLNIYSERPIIKGSFEEELFKILSSNLAVRIYALRLKESIERSAREWRATFDSLKEFIFITDKEGRILRVNKALKDFLNLDFHGILGKNYREFFCFQRDNYLEMVINNKESINFDFYCKNHWYNVSINPITEEDKVLGAVFIFSNITEIIKSRERFKRLFDEAPIALMEEDLSEFKKYIDELKKKEIKSLKEYFQENEEEFLNLIKSIKILDVNNECINLYEGKDKGDFIGKDLSILYGERSLKNSLENIDKIVENIEEFSYVNVNYTLNGKEKYLLIKFIVFPEYKETWERVLISLTDITERKKIEEELRRNYTIVNRAFYQIIEVLSNFCDKKDPYTSLHQKRVAELSYAIAKEMGLSRELIEKIKIAGLLHDIGKILLPSEILNKPGRLNKVEFELIKTHPQIGYEVLKSLEYPYHIAPIVLQHHERLNGSGYPLGLKNGEILLEAKIIQVADVVEAMSSHRPYRPAFGIDKALEEIENNKGILYDPEIVDICIFLFKKKGFTF